MDQKILNLLNSYLSHEPEAIVFLQAYSAYIHAVDDIIDEKITEEEKILKAFGRALYLYSSNFYVKNSTSLFPLLLSIHNDYADSIKMEHSSEEWQKKTADVLRLGGFKVTLTVVGLVAGYDAMREVSMMMRKYAYDMHHNSEGKSI